MKKQIGLFTAILFAVSTLMVSCSPEVHEHTFAEEWSSDETAHWHAATCEHTTEVSGKAAHNFGDWQQVTKEATCTQEGKKTVYCTVCGYEKEETIPVKEHTFGIWEIKTEPTETESGQMQSECEVCGETLTKELQPAPEGFRFVKGVTITGTENWAPESEVFVSGRTLSIPDLIVSDHEVTRGEYKNVMGRDPSTAIARNKEGNKLTGDDVLNNPVNKVNWYDAIVYCNKLSIKENLIPCYRIDGSTDPNDWGEVPTSWINNTWDAATCNFEANGYRLPTEAEWEWLARGGKNCWLAGNYNDIDNIAWYSGNTIRGPGAGTREVKTKAPNGNGLYDMRGNVYEWCWDWDGDDISDSTAADGASSDIFRVIRGGSWDSSGYICQVDYRNGRLPHVRSNYVGFRVVRLAN